MGFNNLLNLAQSVSDNGNNWQSFFFKTSLPNPGAGIYTDCAIGAGIPVYQPYAAAQYVATPLTGSGNRGIYVGPDILPTQTKHLVSLSMGTLSVVAPISFFLCDYLLYYSFIDLDNTDVQTLTNIASLPRYTTGETVQAFFVVTSPMVTFGTITMNYTNSDGVANRSTTFGVVNSSVIGALPHSISTTANATSRSPFIPLQLGDKGIQSIQSVQCSTSMGGFATIVLVKSLANIILRETNTETEKNSIIHNASNPIKIEQGAYLNFICNMGTATATTSLRGYLNFSWG